MSTNCLCKLVVLFLVHCRCRTQSLVCSLMSICILWFAHGKWSHLQYIWREDLLSLCMQTSYLCTLMMCSCCYRSQQSDFFFLSKQFPIIISALTHKSTNFLSRCLFYIFILTGILLLLSKHILFMRTTSSWRTGYSPAIEFIQTLPLQASKWFECNFGSWQKEGCSCQKDLTQWFCHQGHISLCSQYSSINIRWCWAVWWVFP